MIAVSPPLNYPGAKARLARLIVQQMSDHKVYLEPFSGMASVLFAKPRAWMEIINDQDELIVTFLRTVRDQPKALSELLELTPYARAELQAASFEPGLSDLEIARRVAVRIEQSFARVGMAANHNGWRISSTAGSTMSAWSKVPERVLAAAKRLSGVHIEQCDALQLIEKWGSNPNAQLYVDPPYLGSTRRNRLYRVEMREDEKHQRLCDALATVKGHVLLSGYDNEIYSSSLASWHRIEWKSVASNNGKNTGDSQAAGRTEVLWSNRPLSRQSTIDDLLGNYRID